MGVEERGWEKGILDLGTEASDLGSWALDLRPALMTVEGGRVRDWEGSGGWEKLMVGRETDFLQNLNKTEPCTQSLGSYWTRWDRWGLGEEKIRKKRGSGQSVFLLAISVIILLLFFKSGVSLLSSTLKNNQAMTIYPHLFVYADLELKSQL